MPDGKGGWQPVPELLTIDETVRFLRLDLVKIKNPGETIRRYREEHGLKAVQVGKAVRYPINEVRKLVKRLMEKNPR